MYCHPFPFSVAYVEELWGHSFPWKEMIKGKGDEIIDSHD